MNEFGPYMQDSDLIAFFMHEFAHHYGYDDAIHSFAAFIALYIQNKIAGIQGKLPPHCSA